MIPLGVAVGIATAAFSGVGAVKNILEMWEMRRKRDQNALVLSRPALQKWDEASQNQVVSSGREVATLSEQVALGKAMLYDVALPYVDAQHGLLDHQSEMLLKAVKIILFLCGALLSVSLIFAAQLQSLYRAYPFNDLEARATIDHNDLDSIALKAFDSLFTLGFSVVAILWTVCGLPLLSLVTTCLFGWFLDALGLGVRGVVGFCICCAASVVHRYYWYGYWLQGMLVSMVVDSGVTFAIFALGDFIGGRS